MKSIYSLIALFILLFSSSLSGQDRIFAPELRAPEDGQTDQYPNVLLDWDAVTGQTTDITYEVQLATKSDFSDAITSERVRLTALRMDDLSFGEKFYWRVKAFDTGEPSEWSEVWKFQVAVTVNLKTPTNGTEVYADPLIKWDSINGLTKYEMQIDTVHDWVIENTGSSNDIRGNFVINDTNMWAVGAGGTILQFNGTTWSVSESGVTDDLESVYFIDDMNGYAVGEGGTVLYFDGSAWSKLDAGTSEDLTGVSFADANTGWAVGTGGVIVKFSSGTWSTENSGLNSDLYGVFAINASNVWACGKSKFVTHYDGTEWISAEVGTKDHYSLWFTNENNGWVVGKLGEILYYNGTDWVTQTTGTNKDLFGVSFSGNEGYAVGKTGTMLYYNGAWSASASGTKNNLNGIWLADGTGLAGGDDGDMILETGQGFSSPYTHTVNIPYDSASWQLGYLLYGKMIYYRMRALHTSDTSLWSGGKSMETYSAPALRTPNDGTSNTDLSITFKWNEYSGSSDYIFEIDDDENFSEPFMVISDSVSALFTVKQFDQEFFWRVKTSHAQDISDWSEVRSLTTTNSVLLVNPADNATDVSSCPRYIWEEIEGAPQYEVLISTDPDFSNAEGQIVETPFFQCNQPLEKKTIYYWKVRGVTTVDSSDWSETWEFETEGYQGIEDGFSQSAVDIYPNPATSNVSVSIYSFVNDIYDLAIVDVTGKVIIEKKVRCNSGDNEFQFGISDLQKGIYFVKIRKEEKVVTKKLFIR